MASYDTDDPNKAQLNWETLKTWIPETGLCSNAADWWKSKEAEFQAQYEKDLLLDPTKTDSNMEALQALIDEEHYGWARWFIIQILTETEYKALGDYIATLLPEKTDKKNAVLQEAISNVNSCVSYAKDSNKPTAVGKAIAEVLRANALHDSTIDTNTVLVKILQYGVTLMKQRKVASKEKT